MPVTNSRSAGLEEPNRVRGLTAENQEGNVLRPLLRVYCYTTHSSSIAVYTYCTEWKWRDASPMRLVSSSHCQSMCLLRNSLPKKQAPFVLKFRFNTRARITFWWSSPYSALLHSRNADKVTGCLVRFQSMQATLQVQPIMHICKTSAPWDSTSFCTARKQNKKHTFFCVIFVSGQHKTC